MNTIIVESASVTEPIRALVHRTRTPRPKATRAIFLDLDGTLIDAVPEHADPDLLKFTHGAKEALHEFGNLDFKLFVVSNQPGVGLGKFSGVAMGSVRDRLGAMFRQCGAVLSGFYWCPHASTPDHRVSCFCRKPRPGMLRRVMGEHGVRSTGSWMIGDLLDDVEAGRRAGCRTILLASGGERLWHTGPQRMPDYLVHGLDDAARVIAENVCSSREQRAFGSSGRQAPFGMAMRDNRA